MIATSGKKVISPDQGMKLGGRTH